MRDPKGFGAGNTRPRKRFRRVYEAPVARVYRINGNAVAVGEAGPDELSRVDPGGIDEIEFYRHFCALPPDRGC